MKQESIDKLTYNAESSVDYTTKLQKLHATYKAAMKSVIAYNMPSKCVTWLRREDLRSRSVWHAPVILWHGEVAYDTIPDNATHINLIDGTCTKLTLQRVKGTYSDKFVYEDNEVRVVITSDVPF